MNKNILIYFILIVFYGLPAIAQSQTQNTARSFQSANPDLSLIGDILTHYASREDTTSPNGFQLRELDIGMASPVDPYGRFTGIFSLSQNGGEWGVDVEEAYFMLSTLPLGFQARLGQFRSSFGKTNPQHGHFLPWIDYPLVNRLFLGDEGMTGTGVSVNHLIPNPWNSYLELTYELSNKDLALFGDPVGGKFTNLLHLKNVTDISESSTLEIGLSGASGSQGKNLAYVGGLDITYKWRPSLAGLYREFEWRTEVMSAHTTTGADNGMNTLGLYTSLRNKLSLRWYISARYDYSQYPDDRDNHETDFSAYVTFMETEFAYWRGGYVFSDPNFGAEKDNGDHQVFLQVNVSIGAHPAHAY
jgi:hypothetical protein